MLISNILTIRNTLEGYIIFINPVDSNKAIPIKITENEAYELLVSLKLLKEDKSMPCDILLRMMKALEIKVNSINILAADEDIFFAELVYYKDGVKKEVSIDPADGLAIAIRENANIFISENAFKTNSIDIESIASLDNLEKSKDKKIQDLEKRLNSAIRKENYESAIKIRDEIKDLLAEF